MPDYYLCPAPDFSNSGRSPDKILGWFQDVYSQARQYIRLQPAYPYIDDGIRLVNGLDNPNKFGSLSDARTEQVVRNIKELVAAQTNIRVIPSFKTEIEQFRTTQNLLNRLYMAWQTSTFADRALRRAWQYACCAGTGYIGVGWDSNYWSKRKGDITLNAYGPMDILPVGLPKSHNLQEAYCVLHKIEAPFHEVIRKYPEYRDKIKPTRIATEGKGSVVARSVRYVSSVLRRFGQGIERESEPRPWATVDLFYCWVDDDSINNTNQQILMGDPGTSWEYLVPHVGQRIPSGHDRLGNPLYRDALPEDCLLYPTRRLIVLTEDCVLTPDPTRQVSPYWYKGVPVTQFRADDWAWGFLGFPLTKAGSSLEKANNEILKGVVDSINARLSPPRMFDRNTMSQSLAQTINPRIPNQVVGLDMTFSGVQMQPLLPADYYNVPAQAFALLDSNEARIKYQMGVQDAAALARARQLPSGDTLERMMDMMGPLIKDQSRNMESSIRDIGEIWKSFCFQFYSAPRRFQILGEEGLVEEDFDFHPGELVPAEIPGLEEAGYFDRARHHMGNFTFQVTPYSLHELNSITRKLFHLQLVRSGFPIDWWTLAELFDIKNFGPYPKVQDPDDPTQRIPAQSVLERWIAQQEMLARFQTGMAQAGAPPKPGQGQGGGRPPTAQEPPSIEMKSDGRSVVRESER